MGCVFIAICAINVRSRCHEARRSWGVRRGGRGATAGALFSASPTEFANHALDHFLTHGSGIFDNATCQHCVAQCVDQSRYATSGIVDGIDAAAGKYVIHFSAG
jgi:hypothetical protein